MMQPPSERIHLSTGLSDDEAMARQARYGRNVLPEKHQRPIIRLLSYFWGPIPWMIEAAAGLSAAMRHWWDLTIIAAILPLNASAGFWQERKANNAITMLRARLAPTARVLRSGARRGPPNCI